ncbi:hypothetical protein CSAL01_06594 [Colletotrichum salicis]|uniref:Nephrocystin 3-like N-terminal domain-containing protein n=1 Tax=Colletotrichum salicis TaxID=1209931 RepID=A0A135ULJ3_9PEZI|nr:hypothetical protein CSAL01_06594 [Colletotrichum salicis]
MFSPITTNISGLEALGLACNIFQVISFGRETASLVKRVYRDGSVDDALEVNAKDLAQTCIMWPGSGSSKEPDQSKNIAFVVGHKKKGSLAATIKVATKANWRKRRLDTMESVGIHVSRATVRLERSVNNGLLLLRMAVEGGGCGQSPRFLRSGIDPTERKLNDAKRLMQSGLLARICQKADAMQLDLKSLDINLQRFLQQYQQVHRDTSDLISTEMFRTRNHVTQESQKATAQIQLMVDQQSAQLDQTIRNSNQQVSTAVEALSFDRDREAKRRRFLRSFKFTGMSQRRNQVGESCEGTFKWIFANDKGVLEDFDDESEYTITESEGSECSGCSQDNSPDGAYGLAGQNGVAPQDGNTRWDSFIGWLKSGSSIFWCSGKPGSGKSTLMRFIISDPRTKSALNVWSPGVLLVSHFFWRPGSLIAPSGGHKDSDTDWSTGELQKLYFDTVEQYHRPICFFLGGLGEVSPDDGAVRLLEVIHGLGTIQNVKICVASRPEYLIEKNLGYGSYPSIRLQGLTSNDLRIYTQSHTKLPPEFKMWHSWGQPGEPIDLLVEKAEGIFLWLWLAIKSLNRGLHHGNNSDDLQQRIQSLLTSLSKLYNDMWTRLNADQPLYREKAALYFGLVISSQRLNWPNTLSLITSLDVFDVMLITTSMADRVLEEPSHIVQPSVLITACQRIESEVPLMCAGLLERTDSGALGLHREPYEERKPVEATPWDGEQYAALMPLIADFPIHTPHLHHGHIVFDNLPHDPSGPYWTIHVVLPASILVTSAVAKYGTLDSGLNQESEQLTEILHRSRRVYGQSDVRIVCLESSGFGPPRFYGEISLEDSKLLCEPLVRRLLLGFPEFINDQSLRGFEVEGFGERLDDVLERSKSTKKTAQGHLIDLGLGEATVYIDDDGVRTVSPRLCTENDTRMDGRDALQETTQRLRLS